MKGFIFKAEALLLAALVFTAGWATTAGVLDVQPESKLRVEGTSSIHAWACEVKAFTGSFEAGTAPATTLEALSRVQITVPAAGLACKNGTMDKKAREALKATANPQIQYVMKSAQVQAPGTDGWTTLKANGTLKIAGVEKPVAMTVKGKPLGDGSFRFTGSTPLKMSDFGIDPPTAMLGTMKTGNQIVVHFDVVAR
jgi:polyisoprenoid-binding protein YceI